MPRRLATIYRKHRLAGLGNRRSQNQFVMDEWGGMVFEFGSMRILCFFVAVCILVLTTSFSCAEDLTALDGKTYTNITEITKYPNQVFFTYNEKRTSIVISNLPPEFLIKHGVKEIKKESDSRIVPPQTNQIDVFLSNNRNSDLEVQRDIQQDMANRAVWRTWTIVLTARDVQLSSYIFCRIDSGVKSAGSVSMRFQLGEETSARQVFDKFIEWETIASMNNSESFEKVIPDNDNLNSAIPIDKMHIFNFKWEKTGRPELGVGADIRASLIDSIQVVFTDNAHKPDVLGFRELLKFVPEMKMELAQKIRAQEAQKNLFK